MSSGSNRVVHIKDGVRDAVYIGPANVAASLEASPFSNPYSSKDYGIPHLALMAYTEALCFGSLRHLLGDLPSLRGRPLACLCHRHEEEPDGVTDCHADVLIRLLETYSDEELYAMALQNDGSPGAADDVMMA